LRSRAYPSGRDHASLRRGAHPRRSSLRLALSALALGFAQILTNGTDIRAVPRSCCRRTIGNPDDGRAPRPCGHCGRRRHLRRIVLHLTRFGLPVFASLRHGGRRGGRNPGLGACSSRSTAVGTLAGPRHDVDRRASRLTRIGGPRLDNFRRPPLSCCDCTSLFGGIGSIAGTKVFAVRSDRSSDGCHPRQFTVLVRRGYARFSILAFGSISSNEWLGTALSGNKSDRSYEKHWLGVPAASFALLAASSRAEARWPAIRALVLGVRAAFLPSLACARRQRRRMLGLALTISAPDQFSADRPNPGG